MPDLVLTVSFLLWVLFFCWRGYRQGLWSLVLELIALLIAYIAAVKLGQGLSSAVLTFGISSPFSTIIAYSIIFLVSRFLIRTLPFMLIRGLRERTSKQALLGTLLGLVVGLGSGLVGVWFAAVLLHLSQSTSKTQEQLASDNSSSRLETLDHQLLGVAKTFVAKTAELGAGLADIDESELHAISATLRQPELILDGMQEVMRSPELKRVLGQDSTKQMMARNDTASLAESEAFHELLMTPAVENMRDQLIADGKSKAASEEFLAEQITRIWRRLEYLKTDPRVIELLEDPELQALLRQNNSLALMTNLKFQRLLALVLGSTESIDESHLNTVLSEALSAAKSEAHLFQSPLPEANRAQYGASEAPYTPQSVYKWRNADGDWQYSDWEHIPSDKRENAQKLKR